MSSAHGLTTLEQIQREEKRRADEAKRKKRIEGAVVQAIKTTRSVLEDTVHGSPQKALAKALYTGVKLSGASHPFYTPDSSPLALARALKSLGLLALSWAPETLMAEIDRQFGGWTLDRVTQALNHFHETGELDTQVPPLVRQKIYAIRLAATSDTPHVDWDAFEKVGCVFNDRLADFSVVQRLSTAECARTIAILENIRPDSYSEPVRRYIGACAHEDGFYTLKPSKWLHTFEAELRAFNQDYTGSEPREETLTAIENLVNQMKSGKTEAAYDQDSLGVIQAAKIVSIDLYADEVLKG